jgi:threonine synthase
MGTVVGATAVRHDGLSIQVEDFAGALASGDHELLELAYAYSPELLPPPTPSNDGMWRYRHLIPLEDGPIHYPLTIGGTPLVASPGLRGLTDLPHLWLKDETRSPTGSNKDRATALVLEHALRQGAGIVTAASTGNVAVSLAIGAAAAGLKAVIFVPVEVREGKLALMLATGATVFKVEEGYAGACRLSRQAARAFGWCDRNTGVNPLTLEAKKTVAFEIWEQLGREVPDVVIVQVGDGTTLSAMAKGFRELLACGATDHMPRLIGVQAEGCQPLKCAHEQRDLDASVVGTIADGIAVDDPINGVTALRDVRETGGTFVAVSDTSILAAIRTLASVGGILAEPAGAAGFAGLQGALTTGLIRSTATL